MRNRIRPENSKEKEKFWHFLLSYEQMDKLWRMVSKLPCTSRVGTCTHTRTFVPAQALTNTTIWWQLAKLCELVQTVQICTVGAKFCKLSRLQVAEKEGRAKNKLRIIVIHCSIHQGHGMCGQGYTHCISFKLKSNVSHKKLWQVILHWRGIKHPVISPREITWCSPESGRNKPDWLESSFDYFCGYFQRSSLSLCHFATLPALLSKS